MCWSLRLGEKNVKAENQRGLLSDSMCLWYKSYTIQNFLGCGGDVSVNGVPYTAKKAGSSPALTDINLEGITYAVKMADLTTYCISSTSHLDMTGALVDRGANGGIA